MAKKEKSLMRQLIDERGIKDVKAFTAALKPIYKAPTEEAALLALDELERVWGAKYPAGAKSWRYHKQLSDSPALPDC